MPGLNQGLNHEQSEAVLHLDGPMLVLAGAGSGKTRVITHRVAHLMERRVQGEHILAVTFTNKAAAEMRQRLLHMVGEAAKPVTLCTFHSLGLLILRSEAARKKSSRRFTIFETGDQLSCLRELLRQTRLGRSFDLGSILARISAFKNAFLDPGQTPSSEDPYSQAAAILYPLYLEQMKAYCAYDFDDLIVEPCRLLTSSEGCAKRWAERFRHVLVDEYQDTNGAQLRMLKAIAGQHQNLCVVGDDDQSIYGWRGAEVKNILQFGQDFPGARVITLFRNYRSVASVLDVANQVIAQNPRRHPKRLLASRGAGQLVRLVVTPDGDGEARWVADSVETALRQQARRADQIAILYRSNILSRALEQELRARRISYRVLGGTAFFDHKEVKDLMAYLRLCENPHDEISLRRVINVPPRGIGPKTLQRLSAHAEENENSLFQTVLRADKVLESGDRALAGLSQFCDQLKAIQAAIKKRNSPVAAVRNLVDQVGLCPERAEGSISEKVLERQKANIAMFVDGLEGYWKQADQPSLSEFLARVSLDGNEQDQDVETGERVTLSTLHGAKGLEFALVFMVGMEEGFLPHDRTLNPHENDATCGDLAEERRLCYVGITRAKDELVLTRAQERLIRGKMHKRAPSRFLTAIDPNLLQVQDLCKPMEAEDVKQMLGKIRSIIGP